jgi:hypothetical protein
VNRRDRPYLLPVPREVIAPPAWHCAHAEAGKPFIVPNHWAISLRQTFDGSFHYPDAVRAGSLFVNRSGHSFLRRLNGLWTTNDGTHLDATNLPVTLGFHAPDGSDGFSPFYSRHVVPWR